MMEFLKIAQFVIKIVLLAVIKITSVRVVTQDFIYSKTNALIVQASV